MSREANKSNVARLHHEINRLRERDGLEPISVISLAQKIMRFHQDRNPRVAEALGNLGLQIEKNRVA